MPPTATPILQRLEGFPQDLCDLEIPESVDGAELTASLDSLVHSTPTPEARNSVVQVAALLAPSPVLQNTLLQWAQDAGPSNGRVTRHIVRGLSDGTFEPRKWVTTAAKEAPRARDVVVAWGGEQFEDLLSVCKDLYSDPKLRYGILTTVQSIILAAPYSPEAPLTSTLMYRFACDDLFDDVLDSLLLDTSNQVFALALTALVTVLPFALPNFTDRVPLLMATLGRAICWRDRPFVDAGPTALSAVTRTPLPNPSRGWAVATTSSNAAAPKDSDVVPSTPIEKRVVQLLLVALYGAWPSNLIGFIRDPAAYLIGKNIDPIYNVPWEQVWEPGQLAARLLPLIADFQLHPSIISFTSLGELQDEKRWDKYDPSEFVSMCDLMSDKGSDGDMFEFFKVPPRRLDPRPIEMERVTTESSEETDDIKRLKEENELLRLESLYGERLRKQLVYHIGRLHRNSLRFNIDEAEIHTFVNRIKEQQKTISTLTADQSQQRSEASQAQQKHVKWQKELRDKVSGFREERRNWQTEATTLRTELQEAQALVAKQRAELAEVKNERFVLESQLLEATPQLRHVDDYKARIKQMTDTQLLWDSDIRKLREAETDTSALQARCHELEGMLRAREKICREQADSIKNLESRVVMAPSIPSTPMEKLPAPEPVDATFYVSVAENARKRAEKLERENLELTVEAERLRRLSIAHAAGSNSLLYGEVA